MKERFWKDGVEYKLVPVKKERKTKALCTLAYSINIIVIASAIFVGIWGGNKLEELKKGE